MACVERSAVWTSSPRPRACAVAGDPQWETRYRRFEPQLAGAIQEALSLAPDTGAADAVAHTDAANTALVEDLHRAFDLIRQDHLEAARAILFSEAYDGQKRVYAAGMDHLDAELAASVRLAMEGQSRTVRMVLIVSAAGMSLLVLCWFVALRTMNRGNAALVRSHERLSRQSAELAQSNAELDSKVAERTRALEQEIVERTRAQDDQARAAADLELQAAELRRYADVFRNMQVGLNVWCLQDREDRELQADLHQPGRRPFLRCAYRGHPRKAHG